jgi:hypothetical protein
MHQVSSSSRALERLAVGAVFAFGVVGWFVLTWLSHRREAWDSASYFVTAMPLSIVLGAICGRLFGRASWRWPLAFAAGQFAGQLVLARGEMNLWPLTILVLLMLSVPCWIAALVAARFRPARTSASARQP